MTDQRRDCEPPVNIVNVNVLDNPTVATNPFQFEIIFESYIDLEEGKLNYAWSDKIRFGVENDLYRRLSDNRKRPAFGICPCWACYSRHSQILFSGS